MIKLFVVWFSFWCGVVCEAQDGQAVRQDREAWQQAMANVQQVDGVWQLDEASFDTAINWNNVVLVCFYEANA